MTGTLLYQRLYRQGRGVGVPTQAGDTPHEFGESLVEHLATLAKGKRWSAALIPAIGEAYWLTDLYVRTVYSPHSPEPSTQVRSIQTWERLRWRLWLARLWHWTKSET